MVSYFLATSSQDRVENAVCTKTGRQKSAGQFGKYFVYQTQEIYRKISHLPPSRCYYVYNAWNNDNSNKIQRVTDDDSASYLGPW